MTNTKENKTMPNINTTTDDSPVDEQLEVTQEEAVDAPLEPADTPADTEPAEAHEDAPKAVREAAKYRRQLREVEGERDTLRAQLDAMRRAAVDAMADAAKVKPAALWASGAQLDDLLDEAGVVDPAKVTAAIAAARTSLGIPATPYAPPAAGQGNVGRSIYDGKPEPRFADAFRPR